mgnify:FL=1
MNYCLFLSAPINILPINSNQTSIKSKPQYTQHVVDGYPNIYYKLANHSWHIWLLENLINDLYVKFKVGISIKTIGYLELVKKRIYVKHPKARGFGAK